MDRANVNQYKIDVRLHNPAPAPTQNLLAQKKEAYPVWRKKETHHTEILVTQWFQFSYQFESSLGGFSLILSSSFAVIIIFDRRTYFCYQRIT